MNSEVTQKTSGYLKNIIFIFFMVLVAGYMVFPKGFAKLNIAIGPIPLYITEIFIITALIALAVVVILNHFRVQKIYFFNLFLFFFAILFAGLALGFFSYRDISFVLRQSAVFYYALFYLTIFYLFDSYRKIKYFLTTILVLSNLLIAILLISFVVDERALFGPIADYMIEGYYFPIALLIILEINLVEMFKSRVVRMLLLLDIIILIAFSTIENVRGNWIAIAVTIIFSWIISGNKKKFFINLVIIIILFIIFAVGTWFIYPQAFGETVQEVQSIWHILRGGSDSETIASVNTNWRFITWESFLAKYWEKPVTGWGFGKKFLAEETFRLGWNTGLSDNWVSTHNYLISFLFMTGIFGLISFLLIIGFYFAESIRFLRRPASPGDHFLTRAIFSCVFYILVLGLFEVVLEIPYQGVFFWIFFSFGILILKQSGHRFLFDENTSDT